MKLRLKIEDELARCILYLVIPFVISTSCSRQQPTPESKEEKIDNIEILLELSTKVYEKQQNKALQYALTALDISKKKNDENSEAVAAKTVADIYNKLNFPLKSLPYYHVSLQLFSKQNKSDEIIQTQQALGDIFYKMNQTDSALFYYNNILKTYQDKGDKRNVATTFLRIGNVYWVTNNYDKSLEYYLNTLSIYEDLNFTEGLARVYIHIGLIYHITEYYDKSLDYYQRSEKILNISDNKDIRAELYFRMGDTYAQKMMHPKALKYFDKSIALYDSLSNDLRKAWLFQSKSQSLQKTGKLDEAIRLAYAAIQIGEIYDDRWFNSSLYTHLANYLIEKGSYREALANLKKGGELAQSLHVWSLLRDNYLGYSRYYSALGDYKTSLNYYQKFQQYSDSITGKERNDRIAQLQTRFESDRNLRELKLKEQEIQENKAKLQKQKYQLYIFAFGVVVILILSFGLYRQYKILELKGKKIERINEELDQRVKERTSALRLTQYSVEQASDPIFWLSPSGNYIFANRSGCENLEYSKAQLEQLNITDVIPNFTQADWQQFWTIIKKDKSFILETYHRKRSGKMFPVEIILNYVDHESSEFAFAYVRDVSERRQREENLRKAKEKAEEADKLKSAFLANMSHEIRTPMNAIIGFSDLLISDEYNEQEKREFGNLIKNSGSSLLKLIDDIIDISIMEAGHLKLNKTSVNVNSHLQEIVLFFQEEKERIGKTQVDIRLNLPPNSDHILIDTDPVRFRQVINNLAGNALKFTESGFVEIGYTIGNDPVLHFFVHDSGIGIRAEKIDLIFERFNKLDDDRRIYAGTGLGLTISKKIVEELGGFMYVESEYGQGSKFSFTLPYFLDKSFPKNGSPELPAQKDQKYNWADKQILIVEDVDSNYLFLETLISKTKARIEWAKTGKQAIEFCNKVKPDIILMDIQLPEMNGYDATRLIRKKYPDIPIIAQSAYAFAGEKEKIIRSGCNEYITKPIQPKHLMDTLNKYINQCV